MLIERHLDLAPATRLSAWRKMAIGTWRTAKDPSVYGLLELDCTSALAYLENIGRTTGVKATMTHVVGAAIARACRDRPEINGVLRFGRIYRRRGVTLFFQVATDRAGADLSGVTIQNADQKSVAALAAELAGKAEKVRDGKDRSFAKMKGIFAETPGFLAGPLLSFAGFFQFALNLWSPLLGTPKDPLGSVMISSVGMLGIDLAFAPLVPYSRVPMVIAVGAVKDRVVAEAGLPVVRPMVSLGVTFDHRLIDGVHAAAMAKIVKEAFENPAAVFSR